MIDKKTGNLFAMACELGAIIGNGNKKEVKALRDFGFYFGRSFQIQDDLLDIVLPEEISSKTFSRDVTCGKKTYLVIYALNHSNPSLRKRLLTILEKKDDRCSELDDIRDLFEQTGAFTETHKKIRNYLKLSQIYLRNLRDSTAKVLLEQFANSLVFEKT